MVKFYRFIPAYRIYDATTSKYCVSRKKNKTEREYQHLAGFCTHKATSKAGYRSINALHYGCGISHHKCEESGYGHFLRPLVHAQREYRCPKGNIVFANGKNIVQAAGLNIVIPAAAMNKRGAFFGKSQSTTQSGLRKRPAPFAGPDGVKALSSAAGAAELSPPGASALRATASRVGEISSARPGRENFAAALRENFFLLRKNSEARNPFGLRASLTLAAIYSRGTCRPTRHPTAVRAASQTATRRNPGVPHHNMGGRRGGFYKPNDWDIVFPCSIGNDIHACGMDDIRLSRTILPVPGNDILAALGLYRELRRQAQGALSSVGAAEH